MKSTLKKALCLTLVAALLVPTNIQSAKLARAVYADEISGEVESTTTFEQSGEVETTTPEQSGEMGTTAPEQSGEKTDGETTSAENVEGETTTEPETTTENPTTEVPTTKPPTTEAPTTAPEKVKPWGKNSAGQFVNGKGKVIAGATMKGVDVSHHQGEIDWKKVAESDVDYAIIRCGYGDDIKKQDDKYWKKNVAGCEKYNIPYGVYIYSYATTTKQAKSEAEHVLRLIKGHTLNFPIYYDMEDAVQAKLSSSQRKKIANTFLNAIKAEGYECGIYANLNWWNYYLPASLVEKTEWKWVAQYNDDACTYTGSYQMWQCTSEGTVDGIEGDADINFWFGEVRTRAYNIQTIPKVETPKPVTAPKRVTIKSVKAGKKKATVKWKKVSGVKGYQIQYSTKKNFKKKYRKSKTTKKTKIVIKKLKKKKTYYFRVRAYKTDAAKKKVYSKKWSKVKKVKIKK